MRRRVGRSDVKAHGSTVELRLKPLVLRGSEESGTDGGAVKCVDIIGNTGGEGASLDLF